MVTIPPRNFIHKKKSVQEKKKREESTFQTFLTFLNPCPLHSIQWRLCPIRLYWKSFLASSDPGRPVNRPHRVTENVLPHHTPKHKNESPGQTLLSREASLSWARRVLKLSEKNYIYEVKFTIDNWNNYKTKPNHLRYRYYFSTKKDNPAHIFNPLARHLRTLWPFIHGRKPFYLDFYIRWPLQ